MVFPNNSKTKASRAIVTIKVEYKLGVSAHFEPICKSLGPI